MTGMAAALIIIGVICIVCSFFVSEKLTTKELEKVGELSKEEIKKVIQVEMKKTSGVIKEQMDDVMEVSVVQAKRLLEKECNEKIMAISEYSDTVLEAMNKTHNEIMFLYSMLNDKHKELTKLSGDLQKLAKELSGTKDDLADQLVEEAEKIEDNQISDAELVEKAVEYDAAKQAAYTKTKKDNVNHNKEILEMFKAGKNEVEIAKELGLGFGEVKLVIGLYKGER